MPFLKSQFEYSKKDQIGILFLCLSIVVALLFFQYYIPEQRLKLDLSSAEVLAVQTKIDTLKQQASVKDEVKRYPFNPNYITEFKAYNLGMSIEEFERLQAFRNQNEWVNSVSDFKNVTQVSDSLLATFKDNFKFPEWVTNTRKNNTQTTQFSKEKPVKVFTYEEKTDLNQATVEQLQNVSGIGPALSERIVNYRNKIGGFAADVQLSQVWGLDTAVVRKTLNQFTVKTPKELQRYNINTASASDIATIPGVSFELAKEIWEFRVLRQQLHSIDELSKIPNLSASTLSVIRLYLYLE